MLNIEYWKDKIIEIREDGDFFAVSGGKPCSCNCTECEECDFNRASCENEAIEWLLKEYKEPEIDWDNDIDWEHVPVDTEVIARSKENQEWKSGFFALFFPKANNKYAVFGFGDKRSNAVNADMWKFCKLKNPEDIKKYRRKNDAEHREIQE